MPSIGGGATGTKLSIPSGWNGSKVLMDDYRIIPQVGGSAPEFLVSYVETCEELLSPEVRAFYNVLKKYKVVTDCEDFNSKFSGGHFSGDITFSQNYDYPNAFSFDSFAVLTSCDNINIDFGVWERSRVPTECEGLRNLTSLDTLTIGGHRLSNVDGLRGLNSCRVINLAYYYGEDKLLNVNGLNGITECESLYLNSTGVIDISGLSNLAECSTRLDLRFNNISDISPLAGLYNCPNLYLNGNNISLMTLPPSISTYNNLYIGLNPITNLNGLSNIVECNRLSVGESPLLSDLNGISGASFGTISAYDCPHITNEVLNELNGATITSRLNISGTTPADCSQTGIIVTGTCYN